MNANSFIALYSITYIIKDPADKITLTKLRQSVTSKCKWLLKVRNPQFFMVFWQTWFLSWLLLVNLTFRCF